MRNVSYSHGILGDRIDVQPVLRPRSGGCGNIIVQALRVIVYHHRACACAMVTPYIIPWE